MKTILLLLLIGCTDTSTVPSPDAGLDAPVQPIPECCTLLPDQDGVRTCVAKDTPMGVCGVIACPQPDGTNLRLNFCGTMPP